MKINAYLHSPRINMHTLVQIRKKMVDGLVSYNTQDDDIVIQ